MVCPHAAHLLLVAKPGHGTPGQQAAPAWGVVAVLPSLGCGLQLATQRLLKDPAAGGGSGQGWQKAMLLSWSPDLGFSLARGVRLDL